MRDFGANYKIGAELGRGASGVVYRGINKNDGTKVAIKILRSDLVSDREIVTRFITERDALISLNSPHIVKVYDLIAEGGELGIVMEYAPGMTLRESINERGLKSPTQAIEITKQVLSGLAAAHARGIVHRDIKPDNVIFDQSATGEINVLITDFGISKILDVATSVTQMIGTPEYMAPELIERGTVAPSVDVYATGIMLYEMLTGRTPFGGEGTPFAIANLHLTAAVNPIPGIPEELHNFLGLMLKKNPSVRPSATMLIESVSDFEESLEGLPPLAKQDLSAAVHPPTILKSDQLASDLEEDVAEFERMEARLAKKSSKSSLVKHLIGKKPVEDDVPDEPEPLIMPDIAAAPNETVLRPLPELTRVPKPVETEEETNRFNPKIIGIITAVVLTVAVAAGGIIWWSNREPSSKTPTDLVTATLEDNPLPSGLIIKRKATYTPENNLIDYTISFKSMKTPLSGQVMESFQVSETDCWNPIWDEGVHATSHSKAKTSINADCAWTLELEDITALSATEVTAQIDAGDNPPHTQEEMDSYLEAISANTTATLNDPATTSTAYPLQRLQGLTMSAPPRIGSKEPIPITILGVWPDGENNLTPVIVSPMKGEPTSMLMSLTGNDPAENFRLTERCTGAVAISPDGHSATTLHPATCEIGATLGNFDVQPARISITGFGS